MTASNTVVDPGFFWGGANSQSGCANLWKWKNLDTKGASLASPRIANGICRSSKCFFENVNYSRGGSRIPCRRGRQSSIRGRQATILPKFSKKLHEISKILGCRAGAPPLDPPLYSLVQLIRSSTQFEVSLKSLPDSYHFMFKMHG